MPSAMKIARKFMERKCINLNSQKFEKITRNESIKTQKSAVIAVLKLSLSNSEKICNYQELLEFS